MSYAVFIIGDNGNGELEQLTVWLPVLLAKVKTYTELVRGVNKDNGMDRKKRND